VVYVCNEHSDLEKAALTIARDFSGQPSAKVDISAFDADPVLGPQRKTKEGTAAIQLAQFRRTASAECGEWVFDHAPAFDQARFLAENRSYLLSRLKGFTDVIFVDAKTVRPESVFAEAFSEKARSEARVFQPTASTVALATTATPAGSAAAPRAGKVKADAVVEEMPARAARQPLCKWRPGTVVPNQPWLEDLDEVGEKIPFTGPRKLTFAVSLALFETQMGKGIESVVMSLLALVARGVIPRGTRLVVVDGSPLYRHEDAWIQTQVAAGIVVFDWRLYHSRFLDQLGSAFQVEYFQWMSNYNKPELAAALARLHEEVVTDPELAEALAADLAKVQRKISGVAQSALVEFILEETAMCEVCWCPATLIYPGEMLQLWLVLQRRGRLELSWIQYKLPSGVESQVKKWVAQNKSKFESGGAWRRGALVE
jgi:hypothetical protein